MLFACPIGNKYLKKIEVRFIFSADYCPYPKNDPLYCRSLHDKAVHNNDNMNVHVYVISCSLAQCHEFTTAHHPIMSDELP